MRTFLLHSFFYVLIIFILSSTNNVTTGAAQLADDDDDDDEDEDVERYSYMMDESNSLTDMWDELKCNDIMEGYTNHEAPIHNSSTWAYLRGAYIATVGPAQASLYLHHNMRNIQGSGFAPNSIEVRHHPVKGRAVYATRTFAKGDLVWHDFTACFEEGDEYRHFLASIPVPLACDVFEWAYSGISYGVCVDMDEASFVNHASDTPNNDRKKYGEDRPNLSSSPKGCIAKHDIEVDEELLTDYSGFAEVGGWKRLGLGSWRKELGVDDNDEEEEEEPPPPQAKENF